MFKVGREKRESFDYRYHYIKHNNGILNEYYFCSQCYKIVKKKDMEVDHILPNSKWFAPNRVFNCTSIGSKCNKEKSNKMGKYVVKGIIFKLLEESCLLVSKIFHLTLKLISHVLLYLFSVIFKSLKSINPFTRVMSLLFLVGCGILIFNYFG